MSFAGGIFKRLYSWQQEDASGNTIDPAKLDQDADDIAKGLSTTLLRDGSANPTADLPMNGFGLTGMRAGKAPGEAVIFEQLATNGGGGLPTGIVAVSTWPTTIMAAQLSQLLVLTGSGILNGPASPAKGAFFYVSKSDKSGAVTFTPVAGKVDGLASINIYQERFGLWFDGTNWWSIGRQRGPVPISTSTLSGPVSSLLFSAGFTDPELGEIEVEYDGVSLSSSAYLLGQVVKGGGIVTGGYNFSSIYSAGGGAASGSAGTGNCFFLSSGGAPGYTPPFAALVNIANPQATAPFSQRVRVQYSSFGGIGVGVSEGYQNTPNAITGFVVSPSAGAITAGVFKQKGFRA